MKIGPHAGRSSKPRSKDPRKPVYRPTDVEDLDYERDLADPGSFPFTRGIHSEMFRKRLWTMRQYAGYATAEESNRRFHYLLSQGNTGLSVAFDLPTQLGLDSDHAHSAGEVGRVGVAIDSLLDMESLFADIPLERVSTSMTINATAAILLAMYVAVAEGRRLEAQRLRGTIQNDILKEYIARGTYVFPPRAALRLVTDTLAYCRDSLPGFNPISISGYHIREAGATAVQELAFTLADAEAYVEAALAAGLEIDEFAPRLSFFFSAHNDLFEEVAKFRAARKIWARRMEEWGARNPRSLRLRFHAQTAGSTLTAQQPDNNVVRVTLQAVAAVLGGAQSLHTNANDEALALPSEASARLALRTQQIVAFESRIPEVADPLGGSWYLETLTREIEEQTLAYLDRIRKLGGMLRAIDSGFVHREIQQSAYLQQQRIEQGEDTLVGVNRFVDQEALTVPRLTIDPEVERRQIERLKELRRRRNSDQLNRALDAIRLAAAGNQNLLPLILEAVQSQGTVGEITRALQDVFGEHRENVVL